MPIIFKNDTATNGYYPLGHAVVLTVVKTAMLQRTDIVNGLTLNPGDEWQWPPKNNTAKVELAGDYKISLRSTVTGFAAFDETTKVRGNDDANFATRKFLIRDFKSVENKSADKNRLEFKLVEAPIAI